MWLFTTIIHPVRKTFGLTEKEYCIIDIIAQLSSNPSASTKGWCNASNGTLSKWLDTTPKTIIATVEKAVKIGIIECQESVVGEVVKKRATKDWFDAITLAMPKVVPPVTKGNTLLPKVIPPITKSNTPLLPNVIPPVTFGNTDNNIDIDIDIESDNNILDEVKKQTTKPSSKQSLNKRQSQGIDFVNSLECPEGYDKDVFDKMVLFLKTRIEQKIIFSSAESLINKAQKALANHSKAALIEHIENGIESSTWKSPFFVSGNSHWADIVKNIERHTQKPSQQTDSKPAVNYAEMLQQRATELGYVQSTTTSASELLNKIKSFLKKDVGMDSVFEQTVKFMSHKQAIEMRTLSKLVNNFQYVKDCILTTKNSQK